MSLLQILTCKIYIVVFNISESIWPFHYYKMRKSLVRIEAISGAYIVLRVWCRLKDLVACSTMNLISPFLVETSIPSAFLLFVNRFSIKIAQKALANSSIFADRRGQYWTIVNVLGKCSNVRMSLKSNSTSSCLCSLLERDEHFCFSRISFYLWDQIKIITELPVMDQFLKLNQ